MFCEQCGNQIAEGNKFCDKCGWQAPAEAVAESPASDVTEVKMEETPVTAEAVVEKESVEEVKAAPEVKPVEVTPTVEPTITKAEAPVAAATATSTQGAATTAEKKGVPKKGLAILGIVAVVVVVIACSFSSMAHFFKSTFSSEEKYYSYIEKQQAEELIGMYAAYYDNYLVNWVDITDKSAEANLTVELSEDLRDLIGYSGADVSWLENMTVGINANVKDKVIGAGLKVAANKTDILSGNVVLDCEEEEMYVQVPELSKTYLGASFSDLNIEIDDEVWETAAAIVKYVPESKDLEKLLNKYVGIALDCVEDVEKEKEELKVGDIEQKCTKLEVTIDNDTVQAMMEAVLEEMVEDKDLEKLILETMEVSEEIDLDVDPEDAYDEFIEGLEYALDEIDDIDMGDEEIVMVVYVNSKGEVIGREMEMPEMKVTYAMPKKGSKFAYECVMEYKEIVEWYYNYDTEEYEYEYETQRFSVEGKGKESGGKLSGEFEVKYNTYALMDMVIDGYDMDKAKEGEFVGSYTISVAKSLKTLLGDYMSSSEAAMLSAFMDYSVTVDMDMNASKANMSIAVNDDEDMIAKIAFDSKNGKGSKVSVPSSKNVLDITDSDDVEDWIDGVDWDKLLEKLEDKVGVESDYVEMLEDALDEIQ